jgi:hypothetical protein
MKEPTMKKHGRKKGRVYGKIDIRGNIFVMGNFIGNSSKSHKLTSNFPGGDLKKEY